jgi:hypothetical protein
MLKFLHPKKKFREKIYIVKEYIESSWIIIFEMEKNKIIFLYLFIYLTTVWVGVAKVLW